MLDQFGRNLTYLRLSVTDRCNLVCSYCRADKMKFMPRHTLLSLEELERLCFIFVQLGIRRIRLTGGEPLVRKDIIELVRTLSQHLTDGMLDELTLTTNAVNLAHYAIELANFGIKRINVSLDTLKPEKFQYITQHDALPQVLDGIAAASLAGLSIRINTVVLAGFNEDELVDLVNWSGAHGYNNCFIEAMPLGGIDSTRVHYVPVSRVLSRLEKHFTLSESNYRTAGPAFYVHCVETNQKIGFIAPLTQTFCDSCNRIRLTCSGVLIPCLGQKQAVNLQALLRNGNDRDESILMPTIIKALRYKPHGHSFSFDSKPVSKYVVGNNSLSNCCYEHSNYMTTMHPIDYMSAVGG